MGHPTFNKVPIHIFLEFTHIASVFHVVVSSEGALYVILPYDYPQRSGTHFLNTHRSLTTTLSIDAVMTLLTVISMKTKITKMTISDDNF